MSEKDIKNLKSVVGYLFSEYPQFAPNCEECGEKFTKLSEVALIVETGLCLECNERIYEEQQMERHPLRDDGREWS